MSWGNLAEFLSVVHFLKPPLLQKPQPLVVSQFGPSCLTSPSDAWIWSCCHNTVTVVPGKYIFYFFWISFSSSAKDNTVRTSGRISHCKHGSVSSGSHANANDRPGEMVQSVNRLLPMCEDLETPALGKTKQNKTLVWQHVPVPEVH